MGKATLNKKLKSYSALAVSALAVSSSADAQIIYNDITDMNISAGNSIDIDIDGDSNNDLSLVAGYSYGSSFPFNGYWLRGLYYAANVAPIYGSLVGVYGGALALNSGSIINATNANFNGGASLANGSSFLVYSQTSAYGYKGNFITLFPYGNAGNWSGATDKYLGVKFTIGGNDHFGWVRMDVSDNGNLITVKDMAYQACAGVPINAGEMPMNPLLANLESTALTFNHGGGAMALTSAITITDDNCTIDSARVKITGGYVNGEDILAFSNTGTITGTWDAANGEIILRGADSKANYESAIRSVTYDNLTASCPNIGTRTLEFVIVEGTTSNISNFPTRDLNISYTSAAPVLLSIGGGAVTFTTGGSPVAITSSINVTDDCNNVASATVQISSGYVNGEDVLAFTNTGNIVGNYDASTGTLSLSGVDSPANYETALRSVTFENTSACPSSTANRTVSFTINDGNSSSSTESRDVAINYTNTAPALASIEGTAVNYGAPGSAIAITNAITLSDNCADIASASVQITSNYVNGEDVLAFANTGTITGTFDASTGTMNLTGTDTKANYEAALRAVTYQNSTGATFNVRTATFTANDGSLASNTQTRDIDVVVGVKELDLSSSLQISPNPAKEVVNVKFDNTVKGNITIRITDVTGRVVLTQGANKGSQLFNQSFDISSLENGIYLMDIITENGKATSRIAKQ